MLMTNCRVIKINGVILYSIEANTDELASVRSSSKSIDWIEGAGGENSIRFDGNAVYIFEWEKIKLEPVDDELFVESDFANIGEFGNSNYGTICVQNQIGLVLFKKIKIIVETKKLNNAQVSSMCSYINSCVAQIEYGFNEPTKRSFERIHQHKALDYYVYLLLMNFYTTSSKHCKHSNFMTYFALIKNYLHLDTVGVPTTKNVSLISNFDNDTISSLFNGDATFEKVPYVSNNLASRLSKNSNAIFPVNVETYNLKYSVDNQENRFVKYFIEYSISVINKINVAMISTKNKSQLQRINDNNAVLLLLKNLLQTTFLSEVGKMTMFPTQSNVLLRKSGYRQLYSLFMSVNNVPQEPIDEDICLELIEQKSIDLLYEVYCFLSIANILCDIYQVSFKDTNLFVTVSTTEKQLVKDGQKNQIEFKSSNTLCRCIVRYNMSYSKPITYSKPYDPDISIELYSPNNEAILDRIFVFDAKYRAQFIPVNENQIIKKVKSDDISKMHTYRDAIVNAFGAYVLYPGDKEILYPCHYQGKIMNYSGVGAFPLLPDSNKDYDRIKEVIESVVYKQIL